MMDHLPNELILMILNKADNLNTLLQCRLVCRRWDQLVKLIRIQRLEVGKIRGIQIDVFSIDSNAVRFETNKFDFMKSKLMKTSILSRLKQLCFGDVKITRRPVWQSFENSLQQLSKLEHLEIGKLVLNRRRELRLPNIRILSIHSLDGRAPIILDLPKLSKLFIGHEFETLFPFSRPTSVTHLAVNCTYFSSHLHEFAQNFQECEYLHLLDFELVVNQQFFTSFPKLKEIHCYEFSKEDMLNLIKQRKDSRRMLNVQIYFNGFSANELDEIEELFGNADYFVLTTQRIISDYHRLPRVVEIDVDLDYNQLVHHFGDRLPSDFYTKLGTCTRDLLVIGNVDDQADLLRFIGKLQPRKLKIKFTSLNRASYFYENLHSHLIRTRCLTIEEQPGVITDFEFVIELSTLYAFSTNQQIPYELIERLFNQKRKIDLDLLWNGEPIRIVLNTHNYRLDRNESHVQNSEQKYIYINDEFLNGLRQVFGI